ncbi:MAG: T9SS type A sorting domain-containing protein, partial [Flavobacterium sp.]|nr:T9SS type A sorting domain-containing protein [Flavobacterium sp.]
MRLLLLLFLLPIFCFSQIIIFPDPNLKAKLLSANTTNSVAFNSLNQNIKIDTNNDGEIQVSEALLVDQLYLLQANISNMQGIEYFTNLTRLYLAYNNITTADFTGLINLHILSTSYNPITSVNVTNLQYLKYFNSANNFYTSLDFSTNPLLDDVYTRDNPNLNYINLKNGKMQLVGQQATVTYCWTNLPNLTTICADDFEIATLQDFFTTCNTTNITSISSNCQLNTNTTAVNKFEIFPNPFNSNFTIVSEELFENSNLEIYNYLGMKIIDKKIDSYATVIDLSNYSTGTYLVKIVTDNT